MSWYWYDSPSCPIRFIAAGFGFGPRIAAENLAYDLGLSIDQWCLAGKETADSNYKPQLLLNFGVTNSDWAAKGIPRKVFVDCLMWLRIQCPRITASYQLVLAETFFPTRSSLREKVIPVIDIKPLISDVGRLVSKTEECLVLSFGGVDTPFSTATHRIEMPLAVIEAFDAAKKRLGINTEIKCFLPEDICSQLARREVLSHVQLRPSDRKFFRATLCRASAYVIQPGLYGPLEAFRLRIPTHFMFPMSYTQCCQLEAFRKRNLHGKAPLLDSMNEVFSKLSADVEISEPPFFGTLEGWWKRNSDLESVRDEINTWAESILKDSTLADEDLTENRYLYAVTTSHAPTAQEVLSKEGLLP